MSEQASMEAGKAGIWMTGYFMRPQSVIFCCDSNGLSRI
jgi:hypothetical protein